MKTGLIPRAMAKIRTGVTSCPHLYHPRLYSECIRTERYILQKSVTNEDMYVEIQNVQEARRCAQASRPSNAHRSVKKKSASLSYKKSQMAHANDSKSLLHLLLIEKAFRNRTPQHAFQPVLAVPAPVGFAHGLSLRDAL